MRTRVLLAFGGVVLVVVALLGWPASAGAQEDGGGGEISHAAEECIHVLEEGGEVDDCHEAPSPILPETDELIWGALSFLALFLALWKFAYPPLKKAMEGRTERIRNSIDQAEQAKAEAQSVLEDYQSQLADAKNEAGRIIEEARQTADAMRRDLQERAEADIAELRQRAAADVESAKHQAVADLRAEVATLAIGAAEVVVQRSLDRDTQLQLVEDYINRVGAQGNGH